MVVRGAGKGSGAGGASSSSGISAMQTYPARRALKTRPATGKNATVIRTTAASRTRAGTICARLSGSETTVVATTNIVRCARPVQVLTAKTAPLRSGQKVTAAKTAPRASLRASPSPTANTPANDRTQFKVDHATKISPASGKNRRKAIPPPGLAGGGELAEVTPAEAVSVERLVETRCTRISAPARPRIAARATAARRKFSRSSDPSGEPLRDSAARTATGTDSSSPIADFRLSTK